MSLFLRKACQELLDNVDMENYHVEVDKDTKCLKIVGECGQLFTVINGIRLSRIAPPMREINLAVELFDAFLIKHASTFHELAETRRIKANLKLPKKVEGLAGCEYHEGKYGNPNSITFYVQKDPERKIQAYSDGDVTFYTRKIKTNKEDPSLLSAALSKKEEQLVHDWIKGQKDFDNIHKREEKLLNKISSCEI